MIFRGIISSFDGVKGSIILSNGERQEFSSKDWVDSSNEVRIGLEVIYEEENSLTKLRVPSEEEKQKLLEDEKNQKEAGNKPESSNIEKETTSPSSVEAEEEPDETAAFVCFDEHLQYYVDHGFKLVKDSENSGTRTANLRNYVMGDFQEIILKESDSKISTTKLLNGVKVD